jgi:hypothetical protein
MDTARSASTGVFVLDRHGANHLNLEAIDVQAVSLATSPVIVAMQVPSAV